MGIKGIRLLVVKVVTSLSDVEETELVCVCGWRAC